MSIPFMEATLELAVLTILEWSSAIGIAALRVAWRLLGFGARSSPCYQGSTNPS
jgi:hypothetical protein